MTHRSRSPRSGSLWNTLSGSNFRAGRTTLLVAAISALGAAVPACESPSPVGPPAEQEMSGRWVALEAEFVNIQNPSTRVEVVQEGGSLVLTLFGDRSFLMELTPPGDGTWTMEGTWEVDGPKMTLYYTHGLPGTSEFDMTRIGEQVYLAGADVEFDFEGTGTWEPAKLNLVLERD